MTDLKIMPVEACGLVGKCMSSPQSYENEASRFSKAGPERVAALALQRLEEARALDIEAHERNLPAIENNKLVRAAVEEMMTAIGMPKRWSRKDFGRGRRLPKTISEDAGYIGDLIRHVPTDDGFILATATYNSLKARYDEYAADAGRIAERLKAEADAAEEKRKAERLVNIEFAKILLRYGLSTDIEWSGVLETLRAKDKHLDLAIAMEDTRGDWSEGYYSVSDAVDRFKLETDRDKEILNDILPQLASEDHDGRVFRDIRWNYNALYALVEDQQLVADCRLARERCRQ